MPVKQFTVYEDRWITSSAQIDAINSSLRNEYGMKCCMGFLAEACGFTPTQTKDRANFRDLLQGQPALAKKLPAKLRPRRKSKNTFVDVSLANKIYETNDARSDDETKKKKLKALFKEAGITLHFRTRHHAR
jgi:hypothetical protein